MYLYFVNIDETNNVYYAYHLKMTLRRCGELFFSEDDPTQALEELKKTFDINYLVTRRKVDDDIAVGLVMCHMYKVLTDYQYTLVGIAKGVKSNAVGIRAKNVWISKTLEFCKKYKCPVYFVRDLKKFVGYDYVTNFLKLNNIKD